jgi:hypothetical protein
VRVATTGDPLYDRLMIEMMGQESSVLIEQSAALRRDARELVATSRILRARSKAIGKLLNERRAASAGRSRP